MLCVSSTTHQISVMCVYFVHVCHNAYSETPCRAGGAIKLTNYKLQTRITKIFLFKYQLLDTVSYTFPVRLCNRCPCPCLLVKGKDCH